MKRIFIRPELCAGCRTCELTCMVAHNPGSSLWTVDLNDKNNQPRNTVLYGPNGAPLPLTCRHCPEPACVDACPTGAMVRSETTGLVEHQKDRCVGCWMCVMACPFGLVWPSSREQKSIKCDFCKEKTSPACVEACPTGALSLIEVDPAGTIKGV